jgi:hypothetical protein
MANASSVATGFLARVLIEAEYGPAQPSRQGGTPTSESRRLSLEENVAAGKIFRNSGEISWSGSFS